MLTLTLLCVFLMHVTIKGASPDPALDEKWEQFKAKFNKKYTPEEGPIRRLAWEDNLRIIEEHDKSGSSFRLKENTFSDMTAKEFSSKRKKFSPPAHRLKETGGFNSPARVDVPDTVDWRSEGYVTRVKDQGICNDCWAFAAVGALEGQLKKATGKLVPLSEQNLVDCTRELGNGGCGGQGGYVEVVFEYVKEKGISTEKSYPYMEKDNTCMIERVDVAAYCKDYSLTVPFDEDNLKMALADIGPLSVSIDSSLPTFQFYSDGVYDDPMCSSTLLDHGVLLVGYGTHQGKDYWLVKNSWGQKWGMDGYIRMARNKDNQCGIATHALYPIGVSDSPSGSSSLNLSSTAALFIMISIMFSYSAQS